MWAANPGSDEAMALGCRCARMDNNRGRYAPFPAMVDRDSGEAIPEGWYITEGCPVHWPTEPPPGEPTRQAG